MKTDHGGIICHVSTKATTDGEMLPMDFARHSTASSTISMLNLRGNQRTAGEQSRKKAEKSSTQAQETPFRIPSLIKRPGTVADSTLHYKDIGALSHT